MRKSKEEIQHVTQPLISIDLLVERIISNLNSHIDGSRGQINLGNYAEKGTPFLDQLDGIYIFANREYPLFMRTHDDKVIEIGAISYYSRYDGEGAQGRLTLDLRRQLKLKDGDTIPACRIELKLQGSQGSHYIHPDFHRTDYLNRGRLHPIRRYASVDLSTLVPTSLFQGTYSKAA